MSAETRIKLWIAGVFLLGLAVITVVSNRLSPTLVDALGLLAGIVLVMAACWIWGMIVAIDEQVKEEEEAEDDASWN